MIMINKFVFCCLFVRKANEHTNTAVALLAQTAVFHLDNVCVNSWLTTTHYSSRYSSFWPVHRHTFTCALQQLTLSGQCDNWPDRRSQRQHLCCMANLSITIISNIITGQWIVQWSFSFTKLTTFQLAKCFLSGSLACLLSLVSSR